MINLMQQHWLQTLGISLYVPRQWVAETSTELQRGNSEQSIAEIRSILQGESPTDKIRSSSQALPSSNSAPIVPQIVTVNMACYITEQLCLIEHEVPKMVQSQRQLMQNILIALGAQAQIKNLQLKVNRDDFSKAQLQIAEFLQASNILDTKSQQLNKTLVVMGTAIYKLLVGSDGFDNALGLSLPLDASCLELWQIDPDHQLTALIVPSTPMMLKAAHYKKVAWSALKSFSSANRAH